MASDDRFLRIYMTDQLALGVLWREIARRAHSSSNATAEGAALGRERVGRLKLNGRLISRSP